MSVHAQIATRANKLKGRPIVQKRSRLKQIQPSSTMRNAIIMANLPHLFILTLTQNNQNSHQIIKCHIQSYLLIELFVITAMNFGRPSKSMHSQQFQSGTEDDYQKLMDICNNYGLNEEETNQLMQQFKKGALYSPRQSCNDSLNQSAAELSFQRHPEEQYSFKHPRMDNHQESIDQTKKNHPEQNQQIYSTQRSPNKGKYSNREEFSGCIEALEKILTQKFAIQTGLVKTIQEDNSKMKTQLQEKQRQIVSLYEMKKHDSQIIIGLKDIISNLTITLKDKEKSYMELQEKYNNVMQARVRELTSKRSMTDFSDNETQDHNTLYQQSLRDSNTNKSVKNLRQIRQESKQNKQPDFTVDMSKKRGNRIDVKKYKEMIENLRNNC